MIKLNVSDIRKQPGLPMEYEYHDIPDIAEVDIKGPVYVRLKLTNVSSRIIVNGFIKVKIALVCARCLGDFILSHEFDFYEEFLPEGSPELRDEESLDWEDLNRFSYNGDIIDIYEMVRQNILVAIPMKPLCKEDCRGLCPECGKNRNLEPCSCRENIIDPRWSALANLKFNEG